MKKISLLFVFFLSLMLSHNAYSQSSQITRVFYENFDGSTIDMTSSSESGTKDWGTIDWLSVSSPSSDTGKVHTKDTIYLTTPIMDITGYKSISIEFDHVAKINDNDIACIQISLDSQQTWITLNEIDYQGPSKLLTETNSAVPKFRFSDASQLLKWHWGNQQSQINWVPNSKNDFVHETFEISRHLSNKKNLSVRFFLGDDPNRDGATSHPHYGWFIDNLLINGAPCRLVAPVIDVELPENYVSSYVGKVYHEGPYDFTVNIVDAEGVDTAMLIYTVNGGPEDTIPLLLHSGTTYLADIPKQNLTDTICWRIVAIDNTICKNTRNYPENDCIEFIVRRNLPKGCNTTPVDVYPYIQTFNSGGWQPSNDDADPGEVKVLSQNWENATGDFTDWFVWNGATPTLGTGPLDDYPGNGKYLYVESTNHLNEVANMKTPCLDFFEIANPSVRFYVNTYGQGGGAIHVDLYTFDGPIKKDIIPAINTSSIKEWRQVEINMYKYRDQIVQIRFRGETGNGDLTDLALDSFKIFYSPLIDISALEVLLDEMAPVGSQDSIQVIVRNLGVKDVEKGTLELSINGAPYAYKTNWTKHLPPNETDTLSVFIPSFSTPLGEFTVSAVVKVADDEVVYNDTTFKSTGRGLPKIKLVDGKKRSYFDDFEDGRDLWTAAPFNTSNYNRWEFGYPNYGQTTGAYSGDNAWDVLLNHPNKNGEESSYLISPFLDLRNVDSLVIQFMLNLNINETDLLFMEYSKDRGRTWKHLDNTGDFLSVKFPYNATILTPDGKNTRGWNGSTFKLGTDGQPVKYKRTELGITNMLDSAGENNEVLIRFHFYDQAVEIDGGGEGASIDNIMFVDQQPVDATPLYIHRPYSNCRLTTTEPVVVDLQNFSTKYFEDFPVKVRLLDAMGNELDYFEETVNVQLEQREVMTRHRFTNTLDMSNVGDFYIVEIITLLPGDGNTANDTLRKVVENIDGCFVELILQQRRGGPGYYQFYIDGKIPPYPSFEDFQNISFPDTAQYCTRDDKSVIFYLNDDYNAIASYKITSVLTDYVYADEAGGRFNVGAYFIMDCPPELSVEMKEFNIMRDSALAPYAREYRFEVVYANMGIHDVKNTTIKMQIDNDPEILIKSRNHEPALRYYDEAYDGIDGIYVEPGVHVIKAWSENPNGYPDHDMTDDTLYMYFNVIDTLYEDVKTDGYSTSFEGDDRPQWLSLNPYTYTVNSLFEKGTPSKSSIVGAYDGDNAWVTDLYYEYRAFDSSSLVSPFIQLEQDECYLIDFFHNYAFDDKLHDGGHLQFSIDTGRTWKTINQGGKHVLNWYNTDHIPSIPDNSNNAGWSGVTEGSYIQSTNKLPSFTNDWGLLRFRFESDGPPNGDGWAIDNFSMSTIPVEECFPVGIEELLETNNFILGQNRPNPFNTMTVIPVYLPKAGNVNVEIFNMLGQPIYQLDERRDEGEHLLSLKTDDWAAGIYYYSVTFDGQKQTKKMMISK